MECVCAYQYTKLQLRLHIVSSKRSRIELMKVERKKKRPDYRQEHEEGFNGMFL